VEVPGGCEIGRGNMAARRTGEHLLSFTIGLVDKAALWAISAGVARINGDNRNASELRLVDPELAQLTGRPPMQTAALCLPGFRSYWCVRPAAKPRCEIALQVALQRSSVSRKRLRLLCRRPELATHNQLHGSSTEMFSVFSTPRRRPTPHPRRGRRGIPARTTFDD
jgi:hypothetical protein